MPAGLAGLLRPLPDSSQTFAQWSASVIALAVYPYAEGDRVVLGAADNEQAESAMEQMREYLESIAPSGEDARSWSVLKLREFCERAQRAPGFANSESLVTWVGLKRVVVLKQDVLDSAGMSLEQALRQLHLQLVADAVLAGKVVPPEVLREHELAEAVAQREAVSP